MSARKTANGTVIVSQTPEGLHVYAPLYGTDADAVKALAIRILDAFAGDRETLIRHEPEALIEPVFGGGMTVKGFVRFTVLDRKGQRRKAELSEHVGIHG